LQEWINSSTSAIESEEEGLENPPSEHFKDLVLNVKDAQLGGRFSVAQEIWYSGRNEPKNIFRESRRRVVEVVN
jgi:hypothetical protein